MKHYYKSKQIVFTWCMHILLKQLLRKSTCIDIVISIFITIYAFCERSPRPMAV